MRDPDEKKRQQIVGKVVKRFHCFGSGSSPTMGNPIAEAMVGRPPQFAAGVDVREVVNYVLACAMEPYQ